MLRAVFASIMFVMNLFSLCDSPTEIPCDKLLRGCYGECRCVDDVWSCCEEKGCFPAVPPTDCHGGPN